jgi:hypothetical protein
MLSRALFKAKVGVRGITVKIVDFKEKDGAYYSPVLHIKVPKDGKVADLKSALREQKNDLPEINFRTLDGAIISPSEDLHALREIPFSM